MMGSHLCIIALWPVYNIRWRFPQCQLRVMWDYDYCSSRKSTSSRAYLRPLVMVPLRLQPTTCYRLLGQGQHQHLHLSLPLQLPTEKVQKDNIWWFFCSTDKNLSTLFGVCPWVICVFRNVASTAVGLLRVYHSWVGPWLTTISSVPGKLKNFILICYVLQNNKTLSSPYGIVIIIMFPLYVSDHVSEQPSAKTSVTQHAIFHGLTCYFFLTC